MFSLFLFVFHFCFAVTSASNDKARAYFFDVGQGHCFLFVAKQAGFKDIGDPTDDPADIFILIDAGSSSVSKQNIPMLMQRTDRFGYIKSVIKKHISVATKTLIIVTHGDKDHYDRMCDLLEDESSKRPIIPLNNTLCILGGQVSDYFQERGITSTCNLPSFMQTPQFRNFAGQSQLSGTTTFPQLLCFNSPPSIEMINSTIEGHFNGCFFVSVKVFSAAFSRDSNANSIVTRIEYKSSPSSEGLSFMIPGDVTGDITNSIFKKFPTAIQSTVLLASHHGATTHGSNNAEWFNSVKPEYVVFSHGDVRGFLHPHSNAMIQALKQSRGTIQDHVLFCGPDKGRVEDEQSDTDDVPIDTAAPVVMDDLVPGFLPGLKSGQYVHTFAKLCNKFVGCLNSRHRDVCPVTCKDQFGCGDSRDDRRSHRDCSDCLQNTGYNMILTNCNVFSTYTQGDILFTMGNSRTLNVSWNKKVGENLGSNPAKILRGYLNRTKLAQYVRELYLNHPISARAFLQWDIQKADMPCLKMVDFTGVTFDSSVAAVTLAGTSVADSSEGDDVDDIPPSEDNEDRAIMAAGTISISQALLNRFRVAFPGVAIIASSGVAVSTVDAAASGGEVIDVVNNKSKPRSRCQQFYRNRINTTQYYSLTKARKSAHG